jgi:hypothetical protein
MADSLQRHRLDGYTRLFNTYDKPDIKVHELRRALSLGSPLVVGLICPPSFQFATDFWQPREPAPLPEHGLHAVVIIGYDDNQFGGSFLTVNSWGKNWGKNGMTQLRYDDIARYLVYGYRLLSSTPSVKVSIDVVAPGGQSLTAMGNVGTYTLDAVCRTGDQFMLKITGTTGMFVKVYAIDPARNVGQLFPAGPTSICWVEGDLSLPSTVGYYPLTEPAGKNILVFAFATSEFALKGFDPSVEFANAPTTRWEKKHIAFDSTSDLTVVAVAINQK